GTKAVSLTNGTVLSADNTQGGGGTIQINGGSQFTSQQSTISAEGGGFGTGNGGTIQGKSTRGDLKDTQITTTTSSCLGGSITVDAKNLKLTNSQILSTATEGQGGTIDITSPHIHRNTGSAIDASSQSGTNGTVTINGVIQP